jgi:arylsulfatase A-like enzyme
MEQRAVAHIGLAALLGFILQGCGKAGAPTPVPEIATRNGHLPNIIMLTVDTLRADHMRLYGYTRDTMPTVEAFAKTALVFDDAVVPRGSTRPSYSSMLTGLYPYRHGVRSMSHQLHETLTTLPELLKAAGYHTVGFVGNFTLIAELSGIDQGFDVYDDEIDQIEFKGTSREFDNYERKADRTVEAILKWLATDPPQPFFLFTNFMDPHGPYTPPKKFRELYPTTKERKLPGAKIPRYQFVKGQYNFYDYVDRYDAEIRFTDEAIGLLIDELKRKDLWNDSLVIFTADHGEYFGAHELYFEHHLHVWEETVHVPLVIRLPDSAENRSAVKQGRTRALASPMDLPPTILSYLRIPCEVTFDGHNLLPLMAGAEDPDRAILLECYDVRTGPQTRGNMYGLRTPTHKLIRIVDHETNTWSDQVLYNVAQDPMEQEAISVSFLRSAHRQIDSQLDSMLARVAAHKRSFAVVEYDVPLSDRRRFVNKRRPTTNVVRRTLTTRQVERLRSLGYID